MKGLKSYGKYGSLGLELLLSMAVGYYVGHWADRKLGTHWIAAVGFLVGVYAGFRALFRAASQMQRDIEREERMIRGEDPWAERADEDDEDATTPNEETASAPRSRAHRPDRSDRA